MRAQAITSGVTALPAAATIPTVTPNWAPVESWLHTWAGSEPARPSSTGATSSAADVAYARGAELLAAGFSDLADQQFTAILGDNADKPWQTYRLLRQIAALERPTVTAPAASALASSHAGAPPELLQLAFPLEYSDLVQQEASANGFSPLLLLALVRQESTYDPNATANADDTGLTQVVPATAQEIAQQLGDTNFKQSDLLRPNVALRYGAHYLGNALSGFEGVLPPAVAGYNAGPGTAAAWWESAGGNPDLFLETIEFAGTRTYVEHVLEYYAIYLYAYGITNQPTLPLP
jgi:soluble lytic murein transglycosylase